MNSADWLKETGRKYIAAIEEERPLFLGELQVRDAELVELFRRIRQCHSVNQCDETRATLAVAAVHAAVHASEDENSYVGVFFRRLGETENGVRWTQEYGPAILRFLVDYFEEIERPGPFKYVRPVLNHAGISFRALPAFARFFAKLRDEAGPGYTSLDYARILKGVSSRFARNFLQEGPGYDFTREAMQTWERIERGIVSTEDCDKLPGYRRGFWPDLLECLRERPSVPKKDGWFSPPTEHLDYEDRRLVLKFSEAGVLRRSYTLDGRIVQFSIEAVSHLRSVSGTIFQRNGAVYSWRLEPWRPGDANWALFRKSDGALVAAPVAGETSTVAPGEYYLVASDDASVPESLIREEGPYLDWTDRSGVTPLYRIWTVQLGPGIQWVDFDLRTSGSAVPTLAFEREDGGVVSAGVNVFITHLPSLRVGNWSSEAAQLYTVLVDFGNGPHRVGERIRDGSLHCETPLPCRGRIWIEPKGRVRHSIASLPNLEFAVLTSQFRWQKPQQMFSDSDQIPIRLESNQKVEVTWVSPVIVVDKESWRVKPPCRVAEGTLTIDSVKIPFSFRLPRCGVSIPGWRLGPFTLWVDRVDEYRSLLVEALPGREAHLHLRDERDAWKLWTLGIVPESGVRNCHILEFRDSLLSSKVHAAQLGVSVTGGQPVWLDGFVASAKRIREVLSLATEDCKSFALPLVGPVLREMRTAFDRRIDRLEVPVEVLKSPVGEYVADFALSLAKLDRTKIECDSSIGSYASPEVSAILLWIEKTHSEGVVETQALAADMIFPDLSRLPIKRLRDRLQLQIDKARFWSGLAGEVRKWRQEVLSSNTTLVSVIANRKGGKELTRGARLYARAVSTRNQKQFIAVIRELSLLSTSDCDELVGFVGASLHQLAFYHSDRSDDAATFSIPRMPAVLTRLAAQMGDLAAFCSGRRVLGEWPDGVGLADISPVEEDRQLELTLLGESNGEPVI